MITVIYYYRDDDTISNDNDIIMGIHLLMSDASFQNKYGKLVRYNDTWKNNRFGAEVEIVSIILVSAMHICVNLSSSVKVITWTYC